MTSFIALIIAAVFLGLVIMSLIFWGSIIIWGIENNGS